ncbi:MAG: Na+/H+ antiporter subunit G [Paracoccus denitrificans]|nr:MAG: Na+/H+ antiporter subunit G [Paracoccus denitrificans]PZO83006.1 MAG: Na+/H+ antiporter subunit G [Paracoccus denitrificans]
MIGQILIAALLVVGGCFGLIGAWALLRLPDPMTRLHGPTKAATLGVGAVLIASMLYFWLAGQPSWHELLISIFLFISAPITGFYVAKANMHLIWRQHDLPPPDGGAKWATYSDPDKDS